MTSYCWPLLSCFCQDISLLTHNYIFLIDIRITYPLHLHLHLSLFLISSFSPHLHYSLIPKLLQFIHLISCHPIHLCPSPHQSGLHCSKSLIAASEHVEHRINTPLEELQRRIRYRVDVLKDTYAAQLELLEGSAPTSNGENVNFNLYFSTSTSTCISACT